MLSIGDLVLDITIVPERPLRADDDTPATITTGGGGQSANFCAWAASLGEEARLVTRIGDDESGRRLVAELTASGVKVMAVEGTGPTGAIAVLVGPDGERTMATQRGASVGLRPSDLRPEWFEGVDLIHVPAYSLFREPLASAARAGVEMARAGGARLVVDLSSVAGLIEYGPARMVSDLRCMKPDLLFATAAEAGALEAPVESLAGTAIVKLGPAGCQIGSQRIMAPAVKVVDPTGAGDAFAAAFCAALVHGASSIAAAEAAVAVAAAAVQVVGARPAPRDRR
jgi:sugar/nucleoside kinase (ribokinase family)